jgi:hypothetical protein
MIDTNTATRLDFQKEIKRLETYITGLETTLNAQTERKAEEKVVNAIKEVIIECFPLSEAQRKGLTVGRYNKREIKGFLGCLVKSLVSTAGIWERNRGHRIDAENTARLMNLF